MIKDCFITKKCGVRKQPLNVTGVGVTKYSGNTASSTVHDSRITFTHNPKFNPSSTHHYDNPVYQMKQGGQGLTGPG